MNKQEQVITSMHDLYKNGIAQHVKAGGIHGPQRIGLNGEEADENRRYRELSQA